MSDSITFVSLQFAMQQMEATDQPDFIRLAKRHSCYLKKGGVIRINLPELQLRINEDFTKAQEQALKRKLVKRDRGNDLGLIEARLTLGPARIDAKKAKIKAVEAAVKVADSPYLRRKLEKELKAFRDQLTNLEEGYQRDLKRRDEILNSDDSESEL